ncbi:molecular chaperone DnaJ [Haladaptatus cibarius]|uniref:molecular chaperone DnaJ n=1 Tax=Haladaptatus cibarius TaxID=453847 RepID=UPI0006790E0F|nr:molecular chaperone DnaJ [Haladaptatus cibarius]
MSEDFYDVLGVSRDADESDIKSAYRKKAAQYHPDVSDEPDAEEKFKKVKKAKEVLSDDEKRQAYDQMGHDRFEQAQKRGGFDGRGGGAGGGNPFGGGGGGGMGGMGDIFEQFFGGGGGRNPNRPRQGSNLRTGVEIDLEDAFEGVKKQVSVRRPERCDTCDGKGHPKGTDVKTCPECQGQGQVTQIQQTPFGRVQQSRTCGRCSGEGELYEETCGDCGGDGVVHRRATLNVDIPAGIADGQTLQMEGEGAPGENGGPNGDLLIEIRVNDHPDFEREGADLFYRKPLSFPQAVFGDEIEIATLDGSVEMDVPSGTQSGETFRLKGKGMPRLRRRGNGDLYVKVQVVTPESLNDEQKEALKAFAEAGGENVSVEKGFFERIKNSF